jgi:hypothetical protein
LSYDSKDEAEYIEKAEKLTLGIMKLDDFELQDFFGIIHRIKKS